MSTQRILHAIFSAAALVFLLGGIPSTTAPHALSAAMTPSSASPASDATASPARLAADAAANADEIRRGRTYLDGLKSRYRYLDGVTLSMGTTPNGEEAVAYYTEGEIVVSTTHVAAITTILDHEIWHIIDWRDNGRLDWGERLPPSNSHSYASR